MTKRTRALSGAAKDAYIERTIAAETEIGAGAGARLARRLKREISIVAVRASVAPARRQGVADGSGVPGPPTRPLPAPPMSAAAAAGATPEPFDPYSPNVVVVFRTRGREAVLNELQAIDDAERLRLLAREQQLGIAPELASPAEIRLAIVAAAERRIANRRAAAS